MKKTLNANAIKAIAIAAMTADHIAWMLFPGYPVEILPLALHILGRLTCPIMCYFIAEGYHYTSNIKKYTRRLFFFALISHFAYIFASADYSGWRSFLPFSGGSVLNQTSVMWSLAWGLVMLRIADSQTLRQSAKTLWILLICLISFPSDWSCIAAMAIAFMGMHRGNFRQQMVWLMIWSGVYALVYVLFIDVSYGIMQLGTCLSIPILKLYNGQRGNCKIMGKLFYYYYPVHLFLCGILRILHTKKKHRKNPVLSLYFRFSGLLVQPIWARQLP